MCMEQKSFEIIKVNQVKKVHVKYCSMSKHEALNYSNSDINKVDWNSKKKAALKNFK